MQIFGVFIQLTLVNYAQLIKDILYINKNMFYSQRKILYLKSCMR